MRVPQKNFLKKYGVESYSEEIEHFIGIYSYISLDDKRRFLNDSINVQEIEDQLIDKVLSYFKELSGDSYSNKMMYAFEKLHIVGLLQRVDTATMAASVEARVPFVDHRLVEFAVTIPLKYKLKWNSEAAKDESKTLMSDEISEVHDTPKYLLKKSFEDMLPHEVLYRRKVGFPVPLSNFFSGDFNSYAKRILLSEQAQSRGLYNIQNLESLLNNEKLTLDNNISMLIWMLINIELFARKYIT